MEIADEKVSLSTQLHASVSSIVLYLNRYLDVSINLTTSIFIKWWRSSSFNRSSVRIGCHVVLILSCDWSLHVTWSEGYALIGWCAGVKVSAEAGEGAGKVQGRARSWQWGYNRRAWTDGYEGGELGGRSNCKMNKMLLNFHTVLSTWINKGWRGARFLSAPSWKNRIYNSH